jgi:hypothetical protein
MGREVCLLKVAAMPPRVRGNGGSQVYCPWVIVHHSSGTGDGVGDSKERQADSRYRAHRFFDGGHGFLAWTEVLQVGWGVC